MSLRSLIDSLPPGWRPEPAPFPALTRTAEAANALGLPEPVPALVDTAWIKDRFDRFFDVVEVSVPAHQSRTWAERRQYWLTYLDNRAILDCRVVFGRRSAALARQATTRNSNPALIGFAEFVHDSGVDPNQAVLLMRFGPVTIADWSHNGRCYLWLAGNPAAPAFDRTEYLRTGLMIGADFETPHNKNWQSSVDDYIAGRSG